MNFKKILQSLDQLSEAETKSTKTGIVHKGDYGRHFDDKDEDEKKKAKPVVKRGRGRPKKGADETGEVKKYDWSQFGATGKEVKLPKWDKNKTTKHSLKEYVDQVDEMINQQNPIPVVGKSGSQQSTGAGFLNIDDNSPSGQAIQKALGDLAKQKKAQIVMPTGQQTNQSSGQQVQGTQPVGATGPSTMQEEGEKWIQKAVKHPGAFSSKAKKAGMSTQAFAKKHEHDSGKLGKQARLAKTLGKMHKHVEEGDMPPNDSLASPMTLEGKKAKPDFLDLDKDGNKKESMKKAAKDKKKIKEGMSHKLRAAHHAGKSHALSKQAYNCHYDDMEEAKMYHNGYKEGLDECYGMGMYESMPDSTVDTMASFGAHHDDDVEEGNAFTAKLASTPKGGKFDLGGKTFTDTSNYDSHAFESWEKELDELLNEGMTVSISKGQQGTPDSVSVTAQDGEADQLLSLIKQSGLGLFSDDAEGIQHDADSSSDVGGIEVVDDHDGMMALMKKLTGQPEAGEDYADEEPSGSEEVCPDCGSSECNCDHGDHEEGSEEAGEEHQEMVDEVESEDQMTYKVAEEDDHDDEKHSKHDHEEDSDEEDSDEEDSDEDSEDDEEQMNEWANEAGHDASDKAETMDHDFMMNTITGGLNKKKQTGQTTAPIIAHQKGRTGDMSESITDWKKLAGIK